MHSATGNPSAVACGKSTSTQKGETNISNQPIIFNITYTPYKIKSNATEQERAKFERERPYYEMSDGSNNIYKYMTSDRKLNGENSKSDTRTMIQYFEKNTGVFNGDGIISAEELKAIQERAKADKNIWHGFISLNEEMSYKIDSPEKCMRLVKRTFEEFFKDMKLDPKNIDLICALHAANTSKKIRAVKKANAQQGIYTAKKAAYGYIMGTDAKRSPVIDKEVAPIVVRIFEMYASGMGVRKIAEILTEEGIPTPSEYAYEKYGQRGKPNAVKIWHTSTLREMLHNVLYIGHMPQLRWTSLSYKNHKRFRKDESEWTVIYNTHEPIISQELWDKVHERMQSVARGRVTANGYTHPLSGFLYCADCGQKMKLATRRTKKGSLSYHFNCGYYSRYGKHMCSSHYISAKDLEEIVLWDIRTMAQRITLDEAAIREEYLRHNAELADKAVKTAKRELQTKKKRIEELSRLMQIAYEDRAKGKMPEDICFGFIEKYVAEQKTLTAEVEELENKISETETTQHSANNFIRDIKKYLNAPELTREMCYELIDRIIIGAPPKNAEEQRNIEIVYKVDIASVLRHKLPQ